MTSHASPWELPGVLSAVHVNSRETRQPCSDLGVVVPSGRSLSESILMRYYPRCGVVRSIVNVLGLCFDAHSPFKDLPRALCLEFAAHH
jgi:hypothetical protein